jgi:glycosyltransferase involved in cell wall biosynthesis
VPVAVSERVLAGLSDGGFRSGRDLLAADSDEEMERAVATLIEDAAVRERLAESARQRLLATYRWGAQMDRFEELLGASALPPAGSPLPREAQEHMSEGVAGEARRA